MSCNCVKIVQTVNRYELTIATETNPGHVIQLLPRQRKNGAPWFRFYRAPGVANTIWYDQPNNRWVVEDGDTPGATGVYRLQWTGITVPSIPTGNLSAGHWVPIGPSIFSTFTTIWSNSQTTTQSVNVAGTYNGNNYYTWQLQTVANGPGETNEVVYFLYYNPSQPGWEIGFTLGVTQGSLITAVKNSAQGCPPLVASPVWIGNDNYPNWELQQCDEFLTDCLNFCYQVGDGPISCIDVNVYDLNANGAPQFVFTVSEYRTLTFKISFEDYGAPFFSGWYLTVLGPAGDAVAYLENDGSFVNFPNTFEANVYGWSQNVYFSYLSSQMAKSCPVIENNCDCGMTFNFTIGGNQLPTVTAQIIGLYNARNYYAFTVEFSPGYPVLVYCFWNGFQWDISDVLGGNPIARLYQNSICPIGTPPPIEPDSFLGYWLVIGDNNYLKTEGISCTTCGREDRIFRKYDAIKLPESFDEPNRGLKECCCENLVLGSSSSNSWENDKTSAWIKLNNGSSATFVLLKDNEETNYTPTPQLFVNEPNAIYTTVNWNDVLISDGPGCYELVIKYNISGIIGQTSWGNYKLLPYSIENARKTARVRAIFNGYHEIEQINFTGSNVESTHRFYGFIGKRQPNTEIDNLIYSDRQMKRVLRENLNKYEILTDPLDECQLLPLIDLYLLSENELFISDYNAHNFSYRYNDLPVILEESAEIDYYDFSRKASLKAKFGDKFKNKRTYFDK